MRFGSRISDSAVSGFLLEYLVPKTPPLLLAAMEKKLTKPEELLARFRSKEDLYRYMTIQGMVINM